MTVQQYNAPPPAIMQPRILSTQNTGNTAGVKICVYGRSGVGKTVLCSTLPNPIILSAEAGLLSLQRFNLPYIEIKTITDLQNVYEWCSRSQEARQFSSIAIDSITEVAEVVLSNAKGQVKDPRQAYGELLEKMMFTLRCFRDLPGFHIYMSAQQEATKDDSSGIVTNGAGMPGSKLGPKIPYLFDEFFQLDIGKTPDGKEYRFLRTQPDFSNNAKDRSGKLAPIEEPHLGKIITKILSN